MTEDAAAKLAIECIHELNQRLSNANTVIAELRERNKFLSGYLEEAAHAGACGKDPASYLATKAPTVLRDEVKRLREALQKIISIDESKSDDEFGRGDFIIEVEEILNVARGALSPGGSS